MTSQEFGERIRMQREANRLKMDDLASRLKLSLSMLRAIEEGRFYDLPHTVYARGFVRSYALAAGVPPEEVEQGVEAIFPRESFEDAPAIPGPISKTRKNKGQSGDKLVALLLALVIIGVPLGGGWFVFTHYGDRIMNMVKKPLSAASSSSPAANTFPSQAGPKEEVPVPSPEPIASVAPEAVDNAAPREDASDHLAGEAANEVTEALPAEQPVQDAAPVPEPALTVPQRVDGNHIIIQAREECWVQATVDGASTRSFTVYPGETSLLPYKRKITLVLGNAGGVELTHNGKAYALNGKRNEKRTVVFP